MPPCNSPSQFENPWEERCGGSGQLREGVRCWHQCCCCSTRLNTIYQASRTAATIGSVCLDQLFCQYTQSLLSLLFQLGVTLTVVGCHNMQFIFLGVFGYHAVFSVLFRSQFTYLSCALCAACPLPPLTAALHELQKWMNLHLLPSLFSDKNK